MMRSLFRKSYASAPSTPAPGESVAARHVRWGGVMLLLLLGIGLDDLAHGLAGGQRGMPPTEKVEEAPRLLASATVQPSSSSPTWWERPVHDLIEHRGVAHILRIGTRLALATYCHGVHTTYIHASPAYNLRDYMGKFVQVQYRYAKVARRDVRCVRAPCGPHEELGIVIERITEKVLSEEDQANYKIGCVEAP